MAIKQFSGDRYTGNSAGHSTDPDTKPTNVLSGALFLEIDTGDEYYYDGSAWVLTSGGSGATWGSITGTLSNQSDLNNALNAKANKTVSITGGVGISGGGDLSASRVINIDVSSLSTSVTPAANDYFLLYDFSASSHVKMTIDTIETSLSLDASQITTGTFAVARIPTLDASKIGTGTFHVNRIPSLDAGKITTGTFADARISESSVTQHLSTVALTGAYADLTGKPDLSVYDDVLVYANKSNFPVPGEVGKVYVAEDTGYLHRWPSTGNFLSDYVQLTDQTAIWGQIGGTLSDQTDLQNALDAKAEAIGVTGSIQLSNGAGGLSTVSDFFWDNTDKQLQILGSQRIKEGLTPATPAHDEATTYVETEVVGADTITRVMTRLGNGQDVILASYKQ